MTNKNYTISGKNDGFGAQYQALMSGIAYCKFKKYNYIHTPLKLIAHGGDIHSLNNFIGLGTWCIKLDEKTTSKASSLKPVFKQSIFL